MVGGVGSGSVVVVIDSFSVEIVVPVVGVGEIVEVVVFMVVKFGFCSDILKLNLNFEVWGLRFVIDDR